MSIRQQVKNRVGATFARVSGNTSPVYDQVIVGGGMSGLQTALELLIAAEKAGKKMNVAVLAQDINSPAQAGSNLVMGYDGYEDETKYPDLDAFKPEDKKLLGLIGNGVQEVQDTIRREGQKLNMGDARAAMGYQLLGNSTEGVKAAADWLTSVFGYPEGSIKPVDEANRIKFNSSEFGYAEQSNVIGQVNAPEYQKLLVAAIRAHGGKVITGVRYESHQTVDGLTEIKTDKGTYKSTDVPLLATGAGQASYALGLPKEAVGLHTVYTGAMHIQLSPEDQRKLSPDGKPMAFCDTALAGDVLWGALDSKGVLTIGFGDSDTKQAKKNKEDLQARFATLMPGIVGEDNMKRYLKQATYSYGGMLKPANNFALVGRVTNPDGTPKADVMAGWASRGIAQSMAAAKAYAEYKINGNDADLKLFERLHPEVFAPKQQAQVAAKLKVAVNAV